MQTTVQANLFRFDNTINIDPLAEDHIIDDQDPGNYAKLFLLNIVDPNLAEFRTILQNSIEGHNEEIDEPEVDQEEHHMEGDIEDQLTEVYDRMAGEADDEDRSIQVRANEIIAHARTLNPGIHPSIAELKGVEIVKEIMSKLRGENDQEPITLEAALALLDQKVNQNRQSYINTNNTDINRACLVYRDDENIVHAIWRKENDVPIEDHITRIADIPDLNPGQQDFIKQLFSQGNWAFLMAHQIASLGHILRPNGVETRRLESIRGMVAEIETQHDSHVLHMYFAAKVVPLNQDSTLAPKIPDIVTKISINLNDIGIDIGQISLTTGITADVSAMSYYPNLRYQPRGLQVEPTNRGEFKREMLRLFDIQQKHQQMVLDTRLGVVEEPGDVHLRDREIAEFFIKSLPILQACYYTTPNMDQNEIGEQKQLFRSFQFMLKDLEQANIARIGELLCEDGTLIINADKLDHTLRDIKYLSKGCLATKVEQRLRDVELQNGNIDMRTTLEHLATDVRTELAPLCNEDPQKLAKLDKNAKQFARICLYELGELRFSKNPWEVIILMINKFCDFILGDKLKEVTGEDKSKTVKTFTDAVIQERAEIRGMGLV